LWAERRAIVEQAEVEAEQVLKNSLETLNRLAQQLRRGPITGTAVRLIMEELVVGRRGMLNMADETNAAARGVDQTKVDQINLDLAQFHSAEIETLLLKYRHVERLIGEHTTQGVESIPAKV
jgi:hypothetical protein